MKEVDYLTKKEYIFDDNDEHLLPSITVLGEKFTEAFYDNHSYKVPHHIFKT
jgi:hypothetical protein